MAHQITQRSKSRAKVFLRVGKSEKRSVLARVVDWTGVRRAPRLDAVETKTENVGVAVNQSGQHSGFAQVNYLSIGGNLYGIRRSNGGDFIVLDEHDLILEQLAGLAVEQVSRANRDDLFALPLDWAKPRGKCKHANRDPP